MKKVKFSRTRSKSVKFKPDSGFIQNAVDEYLSKGGTITRTEFTEKEFKAFTASGDIVAVDEFLNGD